MRLSDLKFSKPTHEVSYSQYLRKSNGCRCLVYRIKDEYRYQWVYRFPGVNWPDTGDWSFRINLTVLDIAAIIADHTVDPCQSHTHPGPPQEDDAL